MSLFPILLPLLAQIGPNPSATPQAVPPELADRPTRTQTAPAVTPASDQLARCLAQAGSEPVAAVAAAQAMLDTPGARPSVETRVQALLCRGLAHSELGDLAPAEADFIAARDAAPRGERGLRARLGALAANAMLAQGRPGDAIALLDGAAAEAREAGNRALAGGIELDRARALVMLKRDPEAALALASATQALPAEPQAWLLSATLSRRLDNLAQAQAQIERAASLAPSDPEIGLEAGVIAMLAGHPDAARQSWQSVVAAAPTSPFAETARNYLAQSGNGTNIPGR
jgi:tetratricopeptide (TPR) repeat protein